MAWSSYRYAGREVGSVVGYCYAGAIHLSSPLYTYGSRHFLEIHSGRSADENHHKLLNRLASFWWIFRWKSVFAVDWPGGYGSVGDLGYVLKLHPWYFFGYSRNVVIYTSWRLNLIQWPSCRKCQGQIQGKVSLFGKNRKIQWRSGLCAGDAHEQQHGMYVLTPVITSTTPSTVTLKNPENGMLQ